jgi:hypothetical protein
VDEDTVRVPSADETDAALADARRALAEMQAREALDVEAERRDQLTDWHAADVGVIDDQADAASEQQVADVDEVDVR